MYRWLDERLDIGRLQNKFLRKAFPVHHSFFLGEITLFAFITLVITGIFLNMDYEASGRLIKLGSQSVPAAYASVLYIDSLPFGAVIRSVHHWSASIMIFAAFLHLLRILVSGAYKKPREVNWFIGLALLLVTIITSFTGYALPDDNFSVVATKIGYGIGRSIPWVGDWISKVMFGGAYPTVHSLPRLLPIHMLLLPGIIVALLVLHLLIMIKQKHTQPRYAEKVAPGRILGVPLMPQQTVVMTVLFLVYLAVVFTISGAFIAHPITVFGPPTVSTPNVRPDWYFAWIYGILQMIPASWHFTFLGGYFGPELWGGIAIPGILGVAAVLLPFLDTKKTKQRYSEQPSNHPWRTSITFGILAFFIVSTLAGYHSSLGISIPVLWVALLAGPVVTTLVVYFIMIGLYGKHHTESSAYGQTSGD